MSAEPTANLDITIDDSNATETLKRLIDDLRKLKQELADADKEVITFANALGDSSKALKETDQAADTSSSSISSLGDDASEAASDLASLSGQAKSSSTDLDKLGGAAKKADTDSQKLGAGQRGVAADINKTGISAKGTGADTSKMGNDARAAATRIDTLGNSSKQASNSVASLGMASKNTSRNLKNIGASSQGATRDVTAMSVSVLGLGQGITGVSDTAFGFQEKVVALQRSSFGLEQTTVDLRRAEEDLATAINEGIITKEELARQEEDLAILRRDHAIELEEVRTEQEALNAEYVTFAVNIAATVVQGHIAVTQALGAERLATLSSRSATILKSKAVQAAVFDVQKFRTTLYATTGANVAFGTSARVGALGVRTASAAVKGFFAAIGPVGWAIIGITAAWESWNSNLFGFRDAVKAGLIELQKMFDMLKWIIPVVGLVDEAFKAFDPEGHAKAADSITSSIHDIGKESEEIIPHVENLTETFQEGSEIFGSYSQNAGSAAESLGKTADITVKIAEGIIEVNRALINNEFGQVQAATQNLFGSIEFLTKQLDEGKITTENYNLALASLSDEWNTLDQKWSTSRGPDALNQEFLEFAKTTKTVEDNLQKIDRQLDILNSKKNDYSNPDSINSKNSNSANSSPPSSSSFTSIDDIRRQVQQQLNEDLRNIKNKAGTIITAEAQEGIFRFQARVNQIYQQSLYGIALASNDIRKDLIEIATFNEASQGNFANPNFANGGGFTAGVRTNNKRRINRQRHVAFGNAENALGSFRQFFGYEPKFGGLPRRGKTGVLNARARGLERAVEIAREQLARFPVELDYTPEIRSTRTGTRTQHYSRIIHNGRRVYGRRYRDIIENIFRAPTRREAITEALRRSREIESFYNRIVTEDDDLLGTVEASGLTREELYRYAQSDQDLIDIKGKLSFHDRILLEANAT